MNISPEREVLYGKTITPYTGVRIEMFRKNSRIRQAVKWTFLAFVFACFSVILTSCISNRHMQSQTLTPELLADSEGPIITEAFRLKNTFGDKVWPGFGQSANTVLLFNQQYAFLLNYADPADGFTRTPRMEHIGAAWEPVYGASPSDMPLYRQEIADPARYIGQFTVCVGDTWVPSYYTREQSIIGLRSEIRNSLPSFLKPVFPYRLINRLWITDWYIMGMLHEAFHAYVGNTVPARLESAESMTGTVEANYPWADVTVQESWKQELDHLMCAMESESDVDMAGQVRLALDERARRRRECGIPDDLVQGVREREWQEGLAKLC